MEHADNQGPRGGVTPHITIRDRRAAEAIGFYKKLGAVSMDEWTTFRVAGEALERLGNITVKTC